MRFYYGYISGTYLPEGKFTGLLPCRDVENILLHTYEGDSSVSKLGSYGLDSGWSSVIATDIDLNLDVIANPIRSILELLLEHKFDDAKYMTDNMFEHNVSVQSVAVAIADKLMKLDEDGSIYEWAAINIPMFRVTLANRTAFLLRSQEVAKNGKKKTKHKRR